MNDLTLHEALYRGADAIAKLGAIKIAVCGAGALGSLLIDNLVRQGVRHIVAIDHDRVEAHNAGTQLYGQSDAGAFKVDVLKVQCFRSAGVEITVINKWLDERTIKKSLHDAELVIDTFDNSASRRLVTDYCREQGVACVHLGLNAEYGEVRWNEVYRVPNDVVAQDVCAYPLARNLILLTVAAGSEAILRYVIEGRREDYSVTLKDLSINRDE